MVDAILKDYEVQVKLDGETKTYDVRSTSTEQCKEDFIKTFRGFGQVEVNVRKPPQREFRRSS